MVQFANVKHPAPNALCEKLAQAMERFLNNDYVIDGPARRRCLGNVNAVWRSIGGGSKFLSGNGYDQAKDVANALRDIANRNDPPPRGTVVLWDQATGDGDGHIAIADGNGFTVNHWGGSTVVRTKLSAQRTGYVGWVMPTHLGRKPNGLEAVNPNAGTVGIGTDTGTATDKREPLPKLKTYADGSGRSRVSLGDDTFTLDGQKVDLDITELVTSATLDLATEIVGQITVVLTDPTGLVNQRDWRGRKLGWDGARWDISAVQANPTASTVDIAARSWLARRMRQTYRVVGGHNVSPADWVGELVRQLGGKAVVQKSSKQGTLPEGTDQSAFDAVAGLAQNMGWSFTEYAGIVYFGSRTWALSGGPKLPTWVATWQRDESTDILEASLVLTDDDATTKGTADLQLRWDAGYRLRPWHRLELKGLGIYDGMWLVEQVTIPNDGTSPVSVSLTIPRRVEAEPQAEAATIASDEPKDKKSVKWAQWFARSYMKTKYGWGDDQWPSLKQLWIRESGWNYRAENPSSGAYGIPQSLPADKMRSAGKDWRTNPETQIKWGLQYIKDRYGTPKRAWAAWQSKGWY